MVNVASSVHCIYPWPTISTIGSHRQEPRARCRYVSLWVIGLSCLWCDSYPKSEQLLLFLQMSRGVRASSSLRYGTRSRQHTAMPVSGKRNFFTTIDWCTDSGGDCHLCCRSGSAMVPQLACSGSISLASGHWISSACVVTSSDWLKWWESSICCDTSYWWALSGGQIYRPYPKIDASM